MIKLLLADDDVTVRKGLRMRFALEPDVEVVGEAGDGVAALEQAAVCGCDVILMDLQMPLLDGISATAEVKRCCPGVAVVMLSLFDDPDTRAQASTAGACCFVGKHESTEALLRAIREAVQTLPPGSNPEHRALAS
jgi:DNA-binding NarL/FixJ family response regulator